MPPRRRSCAFPRRRGGIRALPPRAPPSRGDLLACPAGKEGARRGSGHNRRDRDRLARRRRRRLGCLRWRRCPRREGRQDPPPIRGRLGGAGAGTRADGRGRGLRSRLPDEGRRHPVDRPPPRCRRRGPPGRPGRRGPTRLRAGRREAWGHRPPPPRTPGRPPAWAPF
ncbi:MAG: hypothetical protein AVDCRST_MAG19-1485 [uncultured Thermomicrobiales bacterium]|uniref:Uncharacterized protein n=1 Tax=uncultured Thermomicrobiales bacterium TaxID=1645740 RepID=A0A6J4UVE7_9BACT|nr:MAG: hypothetical protein AVDCRST_MAG19-1485 [uncultured Thermomicrobiales bacterium]